MRHVKFKVDWVEFVIIYACASSHIISSHIFVGLLLFSLVWILSVVLSVCTKFYFPQVLRSSFPLYIFFFYFFLWSLILLKFFSKTSILYSKYLSDSGTIAISSANISSFISVSSICPFPYLLDFISSFDFFIASPRTIPVSKFFFIRFH